jgi:DNA-binding NarL/FixJ family response regulator
MSITIVVADDHDMTRHSLTRILETQPDLRVVGQAADGPSALELARRLRPDVVLADIRMPGLDGLELTRQLSLDPSTTAVRVVIITTFDLDEYVYAAIHNGACGFLLKRCGPVLLTEAVRAAVAGDALISPSVTVRLLRQLAPDRRRRPSAGIGMAPLTPREREVAQQVAAGRTNAEIGEQLYVSSGTIKTHIASIQRKLGVRNRVGIAVWAWETGQAHPGKVVP